MANAKQQENMLLTEHFTWPPISLIDDIINAVNEVLYRCTDSFETGLLAADPALLGFADRYADEGRAPEKDDDGQNTFPDAKLEIEEGVLKLETLMENAVDKNFDRLEIWTLRNVLCLPRGEEDLVNWVRLGHYEDLSTRPKDPSLTPEALFDLRRKLIETQKLNAALVAEKNRNEKQLELLRAIVQPATTPKQEPRSSTSPAKPTNNDSNGNGNGQFAFLTHTPAAQALGVQALPTTTSSTSPESRTPLTTHTVFTTAQLPPLRKLLAALQPHLTTTALASNGKEGEELTKERKIYVESQSKRILERRGVDTKDGVEGVWDGRRVGAEEVRGLEGLASALGRGKEKDVKMGDDDVTAGAQDGEAMDTS